MCKNYKCNVFIELSPLYLLESKVVCYNSVVNKDFKMRRLRTTDYGWEPLSGLGRDTSVFSSHRRKLTTVRSQRVLRSVERWTTDPS